MHSIGIDLHKRTIVVAIENENGPVGKAKSFPCRDVRELGQFFDLHRPFRAVIEASSGYRWLHELISPLGEVVLAHPRRMRAIVDGRAKTDKLDAALLAKLLRADLIPTAYVPPRSYASLRELTRARARISRHKTEAKNELHALLTRANMHPPFKVPFGKGWTRFVSQSDLGAVGNVARDEILRRIEHYDRELIVLDEALEVAAKSFPQVEALLSIHGVGLYTALLIIAEIGEPWRFPDGRKVGAYAGLTTRVNQSGGHCYHGHITRQGSAWLRWALVQAAMHAPKRDKKLENFYTRIRKRSSAKIARVAVARKLAEICWKRLMVWHTAQAA
jgi:transposase